MQFQENRRQQFLSEQAYRQTAAMWDEVIAGQKENLLKPEDGEDGWHVSMRQGIADGLFIKMMLHYTAGESIEPLRAELEEVIAAYERYGEHLWQYTGDRNEPVFKFYDLDEYCRLMQLIGLCFLLHRRDLLPRIASMQDGEGGTSNGGADTLFEEFMAFGIGPEKRFETDFLCQVRPYENLFYGLTETTPAKGLKELDLFLKHWYKDLAGTGWHDSHKEDSSGYYGYWSFEAGAAVILLGIEDDSSLHKYLYYPKDLVAWCRANKHLEQSTLATGAGLRCPGGEACPKSGWWHTPAAKDSRRYFKEGDIMPKIEGSGYGDTYWLWDANQESPRL